MILRGLALGILAVWASGCATAQPTDRRGLLESDTPSRSYARAGGALKRPAAIEVPLGMQGGTMHWPLQQIRVTSPFGKRGRDFHEGIDLKAAHGTAVLAAQDGVVLYAGAQIRGYGRMIVLRHGRHMSTIYAHNSKNLVRVGQSVRAGQTIALSGKTGHVTGPHLHFEVRDGMAAMNPMDFLPGRQLSSAAAAAAAVPVTAPAQVSRPKPVRAQKVATASRERRQDDSMNH